jgi:DNA-binding response OmpR family regulator
VTKPCGILELVARIDALLRRTTRSVDEHATSIRIGDLEIDPATRTIRRGGVPIDLRPKEYDLLFALARQRGRIVSRSELLREVWGYQSDTVTRTVDTHMVALRRKIERDPDKPRYIVTIRTAGYLLQRGPWM